MKPAAFDYFAPASLETVLDLRTDFGNDSVLLAGGQSLMPLLNTRRARPSVVIDINRLQELDYLRAEPDSGVLSMGALTRHVTIDRSGLADERCGVLVGAVRRIGTPQIRNRGTLGGSVAHADPSAELPLVLMTMSGLVGVKSRRGYRVIRAEDFFTGCRTNSMDADEVVVSVRVGSEAVPTGWSFKELSPRAGSFSIAAVAVGHWVNGDGVTIAVRIGINGVVDRPRRLLDLERALLGVSLTSVEALPLWEFVPIETDFRSDIHAPAQYRRSITIHLLEEALSDAVRRSGARISHVR